MTTPGAPLQLVSPVSPFTLSEYGLSSVVNWQTPENDRWQGGVKWEPLCVTGATTVSPCITGAPVIDPPAKSATWEHLVRGAYSFTVVTEIDCSPVGEWDRIIELAAAGLTQAEAFQVERVFQSGIAANGKVIYPNLTTAGPTFHPIDTSILMQPAGIVVSGAPLDVVEGLGVLETAVRNCYQGGRPVIHVTPAVAVELFAQHQLFRQGTQIKTQLGSLVAVGDGYQHLTPTGGAATAGTSFMYATGAIFGYRGPLRILGTNTEAFDRAENTLKRIAERQVLLGWDCCLAAVLVTLGGEHAGAVGTAGPAT